MNTVAESLISLRLPGMAAALEAWVGDPLNADRCALDCVQAMVAAQRSLSSSKKSERFHRQCLVSPAFHLASFEYGTNQGISGRVFAHLKSLAWVEAQQNLVLTGPSRSGKSHLAGALARQALDQKHSVDVVRVPELWARLKSGTTSDVAASLMTKLAKPKVLVLDDFATDVASTEEAVWLRRLLERRLDRQGVVVVASTALPDEWEGFFENPVAADGIYGRILDGAHHIQLKRTKRKPLAP